MKNYYIVLRSLCVLVMASLVLAGCGGGDYYPPPPAFEIGALVDGHPVAGLDVLPGTTQELHIPAGASFDLHSSGPVNWTIIVAGRVIPGIGNTISFGGATIQEVLRTDFKFGADTFPPAPLLAPVRITIVATSLVDANQFGTVEVILN